MEVFNSWYLSRKSLNRSIHALNGNPDRKKKGPGFHSIQNMINRSCNWLWSMVSIAKGWYLFMLCLTLILASILNLLIIYSWICSENRILPVENQCWRPAAGPLIFGAFWDQSGKCSGDWDRSVDISSLVLVRIFPGFGDKLINRMKKVLKWSLSQKERYRLVNALNGTTVPNDWFLSRIVRNRLIHALTGNTMVNKQVKRKTLGLSAPKRGLRGTPNGPLYPQNLSLHTDTQILNVHWNPPTDFNGTEDPHPPQSLSVKCTSNAI